MAGIGAELSGYRNQSVPGTELGIATRANSGAEARAVQTLARSLKRLRPRGASGLRAILRCLSTDATNRAATSEFASGIHPRLGHGLGTFSSFEQKASRVDARIHAMNIEPAEPTETNTPKPYSESAVPAAARVSERSPLPAQVVCNLTEGETFVERRTEPHVPVLAAFGIGQLHTCRLYGCWDLVQMVKDNSEALFRSIRKLPNECKAQEGEPKPAENWDDLTFQLGPQTFVYADATRIVGFASTAEEAKRWVTKFGAAYRKPEPEQETGGEYFLIQTGMEIKTHRVTLAADTRLSPETFRLHYGDEFVRWHQQFVEQLKTNDRGLSIFEGRPGTGKTFYLRHLMAELKQTHRFYFISTGNLGMLTRPDFVGFWADLRQEHPKSQFVAILEDSDAALMTRGSDNREMVSAILNLTDGMLADFLRLQILCTINCTAADIDPALLRPGRLLNHRVFGRLNYTEARRLAESLGRELPLPGDYSLAEVFAGKEQPEDARRQIGFAAALA